MEWGKRVRHGVIACQQVDGASIEMIKHTKHAVTNWQKLAKRRRGKRGRSERKDKKTLTPQCGDREPEAGSSRQPRTHGNREGLLNKRWK